MRARLALLTSLALAPLASLPQEESTPGELVPLPLRLKLRAVTSEIARTGELEAVERAADVLLALGDGPERLARLRRDWERMALNAKPVPSMLGAAANRLRRELAPLVEELARAEEPRRSELARNILALDLEEPSANAVLGREREPDGRWLDADERLWKRGAERGARLRRAAMRLELELAEAPSENPVLASLGGNAWRVAGHGVELHGRQAPAALARILSQSLRASAYSRALLTGELDVPKAKEPHAFVLLDSKAQLAPALEEAFQARAVTEEQRTAVLELGLGGFLDARGWITLGPASEADAAAVLLMYRVHDWIDAEAQPCLRVGHLNGVCLDFLGASLPLTVWSERVDGAADARSSAEPSAARTRELLWRSTRQSLWGTRAWMRGEVRAQRDPPWARAMLDQDGKIRDANLLKTTLVVAWLQAEERFAAALAATRGTREVVAAFEAALGPLPELEARWRRWLEPETRTGVVQLLARGPAAASGSPRVEAALLALNQARADALLGQAPEIPIVTLDPELSAAAEAHARYLVLNPEQKQRWPDVHEEHAGEPGFSPEGSLAAARALIAFDGEPLQSVRAWLGTFYHRLPLLDPGLFGVGFGQSEEVVVLDVAALRLEPWREHVVVWPRADAVDVPRAFVPELPSPLPGVALESLGTAISVQLYRREPGVVALELELFQGSIDGIPVACHLVSPAAPEQPEYAPENAWGLLPKAWLAPKTRYTARARWGGGEKVWSFTTGE